MSKNKTFNQLKEEMEELYTSSNGTSWKTLEQLKTEKEELYANNALAIDQAKKTDLSDQFFIDAQANAKKNAIEHEINTNRLDNAYREFSNSVRRDKKHGRNPYGDTAEYEKQYIQASKAHEASKEKVNELQKRFELLSEINSLKESELSINNQIIGKAQSNLDDSNKKLVDLQKEITNLETKIKEQEGSREIERLTLELNEKKLKSERITEENNKAKEDLREAKAELEAVNKKDYPTTSQKQRAEGLAAEIRDISNKSPQERKAMLDKISKMPDIVLILQIGSPPESLLSVAAKTPGAGDIGIALLDKKSMRFDPEDIKMAIQASNDRKKQQSEKTPQIINHVVGKAASENEISLRQELLNNIMAPDAPMSQKKQQEKQSKQNMHN